MSEFRIPVTTAQAKAWVKNLRLPVDTSAHAVLAASSGSAVMARLDAIHKSGVKEAAWVRSIWSEQKRNGILTFGKYKGWHVSQCPPDYLSFLMTGDRTDAIVKEWCETQLCEWVMSNPESCPFPLRGKTLDRLTRRRGMVRVKTTDEDGTVHEWYAGRPYFPTIAEIPTWTLSWWKDKVDGDWLRTIILAALDARDDEPFSNHPDQDWEWVWDETRKKYWARHYEPILDIGVSDETKAFYSEDILAHFDESRNVVPKPSGWRICRQPDWSFQDGMIDFNLRTPTLRVENDKLVTQWLPLPTRSVLLERSDRYRTMYYHGRSRAPQYTTAYAQVLTTKTDSSGKSVPVYAVPDSDPVAIVRLWEAVLDAIDEVERASDLNDIDGLFHRAYDLACFLPEEEECQTMKDHLQQVYTTRKTELELNVETLGDRDEYLTAAAGRRKGSRIYDLIRFMAGCETVDDLEDVGLYIARHKDEFTSENLIELRSAYATRLAETKVLDAARKEKDAVVEQASYETGLKQLLAKYAWS